MAIRIENSSIAAASFMASCGTGEAMQFSLQTR
jgi:hypothetical protein